MALTPKQLQNIPENIVQLYRDLEEFIIDDIARRIAKTGQLTETAKWQLERAKDLSMDNIEKEILKTLELSNKEVEETLKQSALTSIQAENKIYEEAVKKQIKIKGNSNLEKLLEAAIKQTKGELKNISQSLGFAQIINGKIVYKDIAKFYQDSVDLALMQVNSGVLNSNEAIKQAVKKLADSGLRTIDYENGWSNRVDVAVRRAVVTGSNQMCHKMTELTMKELECEFVETTAHAGARTGKGLSGPADHASWQGQVFCYKGKSGKYPDFVSSTGYGTGEGLAGYNCRHSFSPFFPGISKRAYSEEHLNNIDPEPFEYDGKTYTYYEALQHQRKLETNIRQKKRELIGYNAAGLKDDFNNSSIALNRLKNEYKAFSNAGDLTVRNDLMQVYKYGQSISQKVRRSK
ncbi:phage minor capsid protein [Clostridium celatum]|uniref:phage minor capsid protein n=1 Tax=Clostridium celatum TaxID=36834 RepID=UPI002912E4B0|nr:phage minor capsid protein [Clostridium celatum]MDU6295544.1 phage minor capsid protein [Clostridium celatum]